MLAEKMVKKYDTVAVSRMVSQRNIFPPEKFGVKFSWFVFTHHESGQNDLSFQPSVVCTALANSPRYSTEMNQYPLRVHQLEYCPSTLVPDTHTRMGLYSLHFPSTCSLACAEINDV